MKNILLPLGNNLKSKTNVAYAIELAKHLDAELLFARLYREVPRSAGMLKGNPSVEKITQQEIEKEMAAFKLKGVKARALPLEGEDWVESVGKLHQKTNIDLILLSPRHHDINEENYLGTTAGSLLKNVEIPMLIVPEDYEYQPVKRILMAVKSGIINNPSVLQPLEDLKKMNEAEVRLLQIKTPNYLPEDSEFDNTLGALVNSYKSSENATLFQGVLEHLIENNPDLICVFRRKRGFFERLWEEDVVKKADFESRIPLLVLKDAQ